MLKRSFDLFCALVGLACLAPCFLVLSCWIKFDSPGSVFFRQERVGKGGRLFRIFKFRTMCQDAESKGRQLTVGEDPRITRSGRFLRRYKLDELPQLLNVAFGDMSLVGPRPEVPRYVEMYPEDLRTLVLSIRPGITDYASIEYRDENDVLGRAVDPDRAYIETVMPAKLRYYKQYALEHTLCGDIKIICLTLWKILH